MIILWQDPKSNLSLGGGGVGGGGEGFLLQIIQSLPQVMRSIKVGGSRFPPLLETISVSNIFTFHSAPCPVIQVKTLFIHGISFRHLQLNTYTIEPTKNRLHPTT